MPLPGCKLTYFVDPPTGYIRIVGRAAVEKARDFRILAERLQADGARLLCLDLSACLLMDSTFSGVLAHLATVGSPTPGDGGCPKIVLYRPNERIRDLLDGLGVLALVGLLDATELPVGDGEREHVSQPVDKAEAATSCLEAHRLLMTLRPENVGRFSELTRMLERQTGVSKTE